MNAKIEPSFLKGELTVPASKSVAHRALIAAALCRDGALICGKLQGDDVCATARCLEAFGARFETAKEDILRVSCGNFGGGLKKLNAKESGSTLRFLLPVACALGINAEFSGEGRLGERPIEKLVDSLNAHGAKIKGTSLPLTVCGRLNSGKFTVDGSESSQFVTGLLFALPLLESDSVLEVKGEAVSQGYVDITLDVLKDFGVSVERKGNMFEIKGGQKFVSPEKYTVEGDWSSAAFFAVGGAVNGDVVLKGFRADSKQSDRAVARLLKEMNAKISETENGLRFQKSSLKAISFSAKDCPDLVPVMSVALACAEGVSEIFDVDRLRFKESDRLAAVENMLKSFGVKCEYHSGALKIFGGKLCGAKLDSFADHRIAMSEAVGALCADGSTEIVGAECVKKSYPEFFGDMKSLGGNCNAVEF